MKLIIARHGETDWLPELRYQGSTDVELNDKGRNQTRCMVASLAAYKPTIVYSSHLKRAAVAAEALSKKAGIPHKIDKRIMERSFGHWEGLTWSEISERFPNEVGPYRSGDPDFAPKEGENLNQVRARWQPFFTELLAKHRNETVALISHGGFIRVILLSILKAPVNAFHLMQLDPAAISIAKGDEKHMSVSLVNSTFHLTENGVSWAS